MAFPDVWLIAVVIISSNISIVSSDTDDGFSGLIASAESLIDLNKPNMRPIHNIEKNLVYSGSKDIIKLTMVNGKIVYEDGKFFVGEDVNSIYKKCQLLAEKLTK